MGLSYGPAEGGGEGSVIASARELERSVAGELFFLTEMADGRDEPAVAEEVPRMEASWA